MTFKIWGVFMKHRQPIWLPDSNPIIDVDSTTAWLTLQTGKGNWILVTSLVWFISELRDHYMYGLFHSHLKL